MIISNIYCFKHFPTTMDTKWIIFFLIAITDACYYKGIEYSENDTILLDEPCLSCTCRKATLNCSLRVCPNLPDPPPNGCTIVHKKERCCSQLVCDDPEVNFTQITTQENFYNNGCFINGSLYSEGSALSSSSQCEYCYCINGRQKCVKPECAKPGSEHCIAEYSKHSCCPIRYDCPSERSVSGCWVNGTEYADGTMVPTSAECDSCYCVKNEIQCNPIRCTIQQLDNCYPVYGTDGCCPHSYNCSYQNETETTTANQDSTTTTITNQDSTTTTTTNQDSTTTDTSTTWDETTTEFFSTTEIATTTDMETTTEIVIITAPPNILTVDVSSNLRMDDQNQTILERAQPLDIDSLLVNSTRSEDDYDSYDYSEPKLPPSLPNLVIFPFVAADAVTKDEQTKIDKKNDDSPIYYDNFFSPPVETQGGFVPKDDPVTETVTYYETEPEIETPPSITMPPESKTESCVSEGKEYKHGESTSLIDCISCVCFYGEVICQEVTCPTAPTGCYRTTEKEENSCCGKISCESWTTEATQQNETIILEPIVSETPVDAIRTEPAPDLSSLMGEILPFLVDQQTNKPVSVNYKNMVVNYYPKHQITTKQEAEQKTTMTIEQTPIMPSSTPVYTPPDTNQTTLATPVYQNPRPVLIGLRPKPTESALDEFLKGFFESSTQKPKKFSAKLTTTELPTVQVIENRQGEEKETDSLSLDSVFHMLFDAETSTSTTTTLKPTRKPQKKTKRPVHKTTTPKAPFNGLDGILKLAGCNIYGRMYRVGKIITELTNPCLECMCTESGVQCSNIVC